MHVEVDVTYMHTNFGGRDLSLAPSLLRLIPSGTLLASLVNYKNIINENKDRE